MNPIKTLVRLIAIGAAISSLAVSAEDHTSRPTDNVIQSPVPPAGFLFRQEADEFRFSNDSFWEITALPMSRAQTERTVADFRPRHNAGSSSGIVSASFASQRLPFDNTSGGNWVRECLPCSFHQESTSTLQPVLEPTAESILSKPAPQETEVFEGNAIQENVVFGQVETFDDYFGGYGFGESCGAGCGESCFGARSCNSSLGSDCRALTVYSGLIALHRSNPDSQTIVVNPANRSQGINAANFDFATEGGFEVGAIAHRAVGNADLDIRFFELASWSANQSDLLTGNTVRFPTRTPIDIAGPRRVTSDYNSQLRNFEANLKWRQGTGCDCLTIVTGFRILNLHESLNTLVVGSGAGQASERISWATRNRLYGAQVGIDAPVFNSGSFSMGSYGRVGLYANDSSTNAFRNSLVNPAIVFPASGNDDRTSFVGEIGVTARFAITENVHAYGRYQVIVADGLSLASEQLADTNALPGSAGSDTETAYFQGGTLGIEVSY